jgi:polygalacturonase
MKRCTALLVLIVFISSVVSAQQTATPFFNIRMYGATGDGKTVDTKAINDAIDAAAKAGGGTVFFPAGTYLSYSIHLKSNISLYLDQGCRLLAADSLAGGRYDDAEPGAGNAFQDFGHSHGHNSLI